VPLDQDVESIAEQLEKLDRQLFAIHGSGRQKKAAEAIGVDPATVNQILAPSRRKIIRKLEEHVDQLEEGS